MVVEVEVVGVEAVEVVVEQGGRGRGRGLCKCAYCHGENHTIDFCWELYGKPSTHQASFQVEEPLSQSLPPTSRVVSILE